MNIRNILPFRASSVQQTFLLVIIPIVIITMLCVFLYLMVNDQQAEHLRLHEKHQLALKNQAELIANPVWNVDENRVNNVLDVLQQDEEVVGAVVFDEETKHFSSTGNIANLTYATLLKRSQESSQITPGILETLFSGSADQASHVRIGFTPIVFNSDAGPKEIGVLFIAVTDILLEAKIRARWIDDAALALLLLSLIVIGSLIAYHYSVGRPLRELSDVIEHAEAGKPHMSIVWQSSDEIGQLIGAFNKMQDRQTQYEQDLKMALQLADSANRTKSEFLAKMSHELRTPLNAIIGINELMMEEAKDSEDSNQIESLKRVLNAGDHLLELIDDILDLAIIEAGKLVLSPEHLPMTALLSEISSTIEPLAEKTNCRFEIDSINKADSIYVDSKRCKQILLNLLGNACKFTQDGKVELKVWQENRRGTSHHFFQITDTGIGMTQDQLKTLFNSFQQGDNSITRLYGGAGLGLAISKQLCELMDGSISVSSSLGQGSTFIVRLPNNPEPADSEVTRQIED